jgi:DNA-binding MurR/RpiR family transcriptional regulator
MQQPDKTEERLPRRWEQMLQSLLAHPTVAEAARAAGVSQTSIWRALQNPRFQEQYRDARREVWRHAMTRLQHASTDAVETLQAIIKDESAPHAARVSAARAILDHGRETFELENVTERIERLEQRLTR